MAFFGKFLKKKEKKESPKTDKKVVAQVQEKIIPQEIKLSGARGALVGIIRRPHITEKTSGFAKGNKYVFRVETGKNKQSIRRAVELRYGVSVTSVNVINIPGKERRRGRQIGWKPGFKKAIVTLKEGQSIEIQ